MRKAWICVWCGRRFASKIAVKDHTRDKHHILEALSGRYDRKPRKSDLPILEESLIDEGDVW